MFEKPDMCSIEYEVFICLWSIFSMNPEGKKKKICHIFKGKEGESGNMEHLKY